MRITALAGLFAMSVIFIATSSKAHAQTINIKDFINTSDATSIAFADTPAATPAEATPPSPAPPAPQSYTIVPGDTLSKIAAGYQTTWKRLYDKNTQIADPNIINAGDVITIPTADEVIVERALPTPPPPAPQAAYTPAVSSSGSAAAKSAPQRSSYNAPASSGGNSYTPGYCTWYVKNKRPDLPNNLGNADTWVARAQAQGLATGAAPHAGAVGQSGMHVVYVEAVNGDGSVTISEMNHIGLFQTDTRTVPAGSFYYIY